MTFSGRVRKNATKTKINDVKWKTEWSKTKLGVYLGIVCRIKLSVRCESI